jgi:hypothetical protein
MAATNYITGSTGTALFRVPDPFKNMIELERRRWEHMVAGHPEMASLRRAVENTVRNPGAVYLSSISDQSLLFHGYNLLIPDQRIIRVVITYDSIADIEDVRQGGYSGIVNTAWPLRASNEMSGNIGAEFYRRPPAPKNKGRRRR